MASHDSKEYHDGSEAGERFDLTMTRLLQVSKGELAKREAAYKKARRVRRLGRTKTALRQVLPLVKVDA